MRYKRLFIQNSYIFELFAVCILPDHLHVIIRPSDINEYPKIITAIKYYFSRRLNAVGGETPTYGYKNKVEKAVWQSRYWEHTLRDEKDLNNHLDYIHYNRVKHGFIQNVKDWEFSSFNKFVESKNYDINWVSSKDIENIKQLDYE